VTAGFHGEFTFTFSVRRNIAVFGAPNSVANFDCAAVRRACNLTIAGSESQPTTSRGLTFSPRLASVTPAIFADPDIGLHDHQGVKVTLRGFTPNQPVQIVECSGEAIEGNADLSYCDYTTVQTVTPTGATLDTKFIVRAVVGGQGGLVD